MSKSGKSNVLYFIRDLTHERRERRRRRRGTGERRRRCRRRGRPFCLYDKLSQQFSERDAKN